MASCYGSMLILLMGVSGSPVHVYMLISHCCFKKTVKTLTLVIMAAVSDRKFDFFPLQILFLPTYNLKRKGSSSKLVQ